ncbi:GspE/PulE family protein [Vibrio gallicus]|uniref:GspE/PulE family protein n=1 Tax=Vibrio gallicus TaxID=190897 RepID=UPI0021C353CB|nr:GspE/PulE family protein [Vibrio gallicus]
MRLYLEAMRQAELISLSLYHKVINQQMNLRDLLSYIETYQTVDQQQIAQLLAQVSKLNLIECVNSSGDEIEALDKQFSVHYDSLLPIEFSHNQLHLVSYDPDASQLCRELEFMHKIETKLSLVSWPYFADLNSPSSNSDSELLEQMLTQAYQQQASDIHIQPQLNSVWIRFRCDGQLQHWRSLASTKALPLISRIKILANLDITERRLPQDGRLSFDITGKNIDFRISTLPSCHGEKVVLRLRADPIIPNLDALGMHCYQLAHLKQQLTKPNGLILVTGPTGSGKSLTLYSMLQSLHDPRLSICTIEDPIEIQVEEYNQIQIDPSLHFGFATALRALLRQDPDIIMLGEIRDSESAQIAIHAAQTGHLVFSTLHTNNAQESLLRLANLGVSDLDITSTVKLVVAQRLIRTLCKHCNTSCHHCHEGYKGRMGIFELLSIDQQSDINHQPSGNLIQGISLRKAAQYCLDQRLTDQAEIKRVLGSESSNA